MRQVAPDRIVVSVVPGPDFGHLAGGDGQRAAGGPHTLGPYVGHEAALEFLRQRLEGQVRGEAALEIRLVDEIRSVRAASIGSSSRMVWHERANRLSSTTCASAWSARFRPAQAA